MQTGRLFSLVAVLQVCCGTSAQISITDVGRLDFILANVPVNGLSGITYVGEDEYLAVSDDSTYLHRLAIKLDRATGQIEHVDAQHGVQLRDADGLPMLEVEQKDREDLAISSDGSHVLFVNERCGSAKPSSCIDRHSLETGRLLSRTGTDAGGQLGVFRHADLNRGFEAIAARPNGRGFWVATERALSVDGEAANTNAGSPVRLQLLNAGLKGLAQYVYMTDTISRPIESPEHFARHSGSRVVGLLALPDDTLVVLENVFQGNNRRVSADPHSPISGRSLQSDRRVDSRVCGRAPSEEIRAR